MRQFVLVPLALFAVAACAKKDGATDSAAAVVSTDAGSNSGDISPDSLAKLMKPYSPSESGQGEVILSIDRSKDREGMYRDIGAVRTCGPSGAGGKDFTVSFTAGGTGAKDKPLQTLTFRATDLAVGKPATSFTVEAKIQNFDAEKLEAKPLPAFNWAPGTSGTGKATLTNKDGVLRLEADGKTDHDERIELTVQCKP